MLSTQPSNKKSCITTLNISCVAVAGAVVVFLVVMLTVILVLSNKVKQTTRQALESSPTHGEGKTKIITRENVHLMQDAEVRAAIMKMHSTPNVHDKDTIFVAISSFRDSELCLTLKDIINKAAFPRRVHIAVFQQNDPKDPAECHAEYAEIPSSNVTIKTVHYSAAKGPTWARHLCEKMYRGENWHLMVDSHMRLEPGWDRDLIEMILATENPRRSVITMYPEGYTRIESGDEIKYTVGTRRGFRTAKFKHFNDQGIPEFESVGIASKARAPVLTRWWGACFHFAHSDALKLAPFSPNTPFLFFGEEIFMAGRYWTHGFDLYAPTHSVCYHLWTRDHRKMYWSHDVIELRDKSIRLVQDILTGNVVDDTYGLGHVRAWQQFWDYIGLDPVARKLKRNM